MVDHSAWNKDTPLSIWNLSTELITLFANRGRCGRKLVRGACPEQNDRDETKKDRVDIYEGQKLQPPRRSYAITTDNLARSLYRHKRSVSCITTGIISRRVARHISEFAIDCALHRVYPLEDEEILQGLRAMTSSSSLLRVCQDCVVFGENVA